MDSIGIDPAQLLSLTIGQSVHGTESNVEATGANVDSEDVDLPAVEGQLPAGAAVGRVPATDGGCTADVGEVWEGSEGAETCVIIRKDRSVNEFESRMSEGTRKGAILRWMRGKEREVITFGQHAVGAIRASDGSKGVASVVVSLVVRNANGGSESGGDGSESSEDGGEPHDESVKLFEGRVWCGVKLEWIVIEECKRSLLACRIASVKRDSLYSKIQQGPSAQSDLENQMDVEQRPGPENDQSSMNDKSSGSNDR